MIFDRVRESTSTTGTSTYSLLGATAGYRTFATAAGSGFLIYYCCTDGTNWEVGYGTVTAGTPDTLTRTVISSSNANAAVNWSSGSKTIFGTYPGGSKAIFANQNGAVVLPGNLGIGMVPANILDITQTQNGGSAVSILNASTGASAFTQVLLQNGTSTGAIVQWGSGFTASGLNRQNGTLLNGGGAGGLTLSTGNQPIYFGINNVEVARIDTSGNALINTTAAIPSGALGKLSVLASGGGVAISAYQPASAASVTYYSETVTVSGTGFQHFAAAVGNGTSVTTNVFSVLGNGNVQNTNNSYGSISDPKLKQDIVKADSQWNDVKTLAANVAKYRLKSDPTGPLLLGFMSKDVSDSNGAALIGVRSISPGLVVTTPDTMIVDVAKLDEEGHPVLDEHGDPVMVEERRLTGDTTDSVAYSVAFMKAFKALGEALERIETLEAKVASLLANG